MRCLVDTFEKIDGCTVEGHKEKECKDSNEKQEAVESNLPGGRKKRKESMSFWGKAFFI